MRPLLAALVLLLLLAPEASAQPAVGQPSPNAPTQAEVAAQATFGTSYLLALYMMQMANAGKPPSQADIDEAARQYLTNGAEVTGVAASGPSSAYFRNGAAVTGVPSGGPGAAYFHDGAGVLASAPPSSVRGANATAEVAAGSLERESREEDVAVPPTEGAKDATPALPASAEQAPVQAQPGIPAVAGPTCATIHEIEAAMAIARHFEGSSSPPPAVSCMPPTAQTSVPPCTEVAAAEPAPRCPSGPSGLSPITAALGGALLGGFAIALWSRPRRETRDSSV